MPSAGEARQRAVGDGGGERDRLPKFNKQLPKYSTYIGDLEAGRETVLWEAEDTPNGPGKSSRQPPRNIFDDI